MLPPSFVGIGKDSHFCIAVSLERERDFKNENAVQDRQVGRWQYELSGDILYLVIGLCLHPLTYF